MTPTVSDIVAREADRWRRERVEEMVARAKLASHRTPEHARWCRHLYDRRCLSDAHTACMVASREGSAA